MILSLPVWKLKSEGIILPEERLPVGQTIIVGLQHVFTMFGSTVLLPIFMGFDPNVAILFSGVGTLIFFIAVAGRVPSYLGTSGSFVTAIIAATAYAGSGQNPNIAIALGGIIAAGALYTAIGVAVVVIGYSWVEKLMPPVVTGAVIAVIGLNLAPVVVKGVSGRALDSAVAVMTVLAIGAVAVFGPKFWRRIPILIGGSFGYLVYWLLASGFGHGTPIDFHRIADAHWLGIPNFSAPGFSLSATITIAPIAIILVAENLGHLKALSAMIGRNLDPYIGRAFIGDGIATMVAGSAGGSGVTTYAENIGVLGISKVYSTLIFVVAGISAILLGFSPKFGALILTIPAPVISGLTIVIFGLVAATAGRVWSEHNVDFSKASNLITVGATLIAGAGNLSFNFGGLSLGGIATATLLAIILHHLLHNKFNAQADVKDADAWATHAEIARAAAHTMAEEAIASIAHEIRQPLASIVTNAHAAVRWLERTPPDLDEARAALTKVAAVGNRANETIEGVRAIFRRESQPRTALDPNKLVLSVLAILSDELKSQRITVQTELIEGPPALLGDRVQLQQVVLNLIMNAIEAMSSVVGRDRILKIKSERHELGGVLITMKDSGSGIDPKDTERIFTAFFTTKARGMGIGLSICRSIVEAHGGRLWASAASPHGSIFYLVLPKFDAEGARRTD